MPPAQLNKTDGPFGKNLLNCWTTALLCEQLMLFFWGSHIQRVLKTVARFLNILPTFMPQVGAVCW